MEEPSRSEPCFACVTETAIHSTHWYDGGDGVDVTLARKPQARGVPESVVREVEREKKHVEALYPRLNNIPKTPVEVPEPEIELDGEGCRVRM